MRRHCRELFDLIGTAAVIAIIMVIAAVLYLWGD